MVVWVQKYFGSKNFGFKIFWEKIGFKLDFKTRAIGLKKFEGQKIFWSIKEVKVPKKWGPKKV